MSNDTDSTITTATMLGFFFAATNEKAENSKNDRSQMLIQPCNDNDDLILRLRRTGSHGPYI